jgi:assimilatory nitrate reductase catalytic subunit
LFATDEPAGAWCDFVRRSLPKDAQIAEFSDGGRSLTRVAAFLDGVLEGVVFVGPADAMPRWDVVRALFAQPVLSERERRTLLSGRSADGLADAGPLICACFGVGLSAIREAITGGAVSVDAIGKKLRAGTNCGSCIPELRGIIERAVRAPQPA